MGLEDGSRCRVIDGARREVRFLVRHPVPFTARGEQAKCVIPREGEKGAQVCRTAPRPSGRCDACPTVGDTRLL